MPLQTYRAVVGLVAGAMAGAGACEVEGSAFQNS